MSHSLLIIWIHCVFGTKDRSELINNTFETDLYNHIKQKLEEELDCMLKIINGTADHIHILFLISPNFSIRDIIKNIQGESSHWINQSDFMNTKFAWQTAYCAFSVSESMVKDI